MTDDPTTKPCPLAHPDHKRVGRTITGVWYGCASCGGTGRVAMDTGELLEALAARGVVQLTGYDNGMWTCVGTGTTSGKPKPRDEALRAALQEVTP